MAESVETPEPEIEGYEYVEPYEIMKALEGYKNTVYKCTSGYTTIGVGFNMDQDGAQMLWDSVGVEEEFQEVYDGAKLSDESMGKLFTVAWGHSEKLAKHRCTQLRVSWEELADWHKFVLADIAYNTGSVRRWSKVFKETETERILLEARRRPYELMDSRVAKIAYRYGLVQSVEDAQKIGLEYARYIS